MSGHRKTFAEGTLVLALLGILAGAIGGLAVGIVTGPRTTPPISAR